MTTYTKMTKEIIFSNGTTQQLTFEETREMFYPMVVKKMKQANNKFIFNAVEEEDFMQIMEIELWRAYEQYDPSTGYCFSTFLFHKLKKGVRNATYSKFAKKRQGSVVSINAPQGENGEQQLEDLLVAEGTSSDNLTYNELVNIVLKNVEESEMDAFKSLLNKKDFSVQDYADKHGISRQAANQRIVKLRNKLRKVVREQYLSI